MVSRRQKLGLEDKPKGWKGHEAEVARSVGGRVQPGSGSSMYAKGDVKSASYLIECKQTDSGGLHLKGDWLEKIYREALAAGKLPALSVRLDGLADAGCPKTWVMIPLSEFESLMDKSE